MNMNINFYVRHENEVVWNGATFARFDNETEEEAIARLNDTLDHADARFTRDEDFEH